MSEETTRVEEQAVVETPTQENNEEVGGLFENGKLRRSRI